MRVEKQKGSFTIEATILIPIFLFTLIMVIEKGLDFYGQINKRSTLEKLQSWDAVTVFYSIQNLEDLGEEIRDD